ncbi:TldD/PmbA family protein [Falcatimonas sp. MSJ-15]|uniref:metallopeptidase TldD-related protein n=1 Tax=Falcatimonas sp. MSJ-15 TaxID=2841515 RepID=UPI001C0F4AC1|nr:metallopeptidase TldD-related protein [Falcatimonas sp. MSJ-15]MBU5470042.1 TldD/PmbA family protein [Falcatimonas sp. MSJ-15]
MIDIILKAIKNNSIEKYLIEEKVTKSAELFFVKKELDMRRMKNVAHYTVTVFRDFEENDIKYRGSSIVNIVPEMDEDMIEKAISEAYYAAQFVKNKYYELIKGEKKEMKVMPSSFENYTLNEACNAFVEALYKEDVRKESFINSAEFFVNKNVVRIINSEGIDVSYTRYNANGEFVVQCIEPQDVELYQNFEYTDLDTEALSRQVREALDTVCARANAKTAPKKGEYTVILSGKNLSQLFEYYAARTSVGYIYAGISDLKPGDNVQREDASGEKVNVTLKSTIPYSLEGIEMKDVEIVQEGIVKNIYGNARISYYLGVEPTGMPDAVSVDNGTVTFEEMKKEPYLYVVNFSDFSVNPLTGFFGGEIRLGYLFDGENVTPVTGGSISGNFIELQNNLVFSKERYKDSKYEGPFAVRIKNVQVAGE